MVKKCERCGFDEQENNLYRNMECLESAFWQIWNFEVSYTGLKKNMFSTPIAKKAKRIKEQIEELKLEYLKGNQRKERL